jgi:predicted unusual protein kinase regulating ubiquinone biosynthesis (AarF/ABC1/UbiB family)
MIYNLSNYNGKKIKRGTFPEYEQELREVFSKINNKNLDELEGMKLLTGMLDKIRDHNMKLDGEFATLLTNIVVMEGLARDLDPKINILKCAIPYFENNNHPIADKAEKSFLTAV